MKEQVGEPKEVQVVGGGRETDLPKFLSQDIKTMSGSVSGDMCRNEVLRPKGKTDNQGPGDIEPLRRAQAQEGRGGRTVPFLPA